MSIASNVSLGAMRIQAQQRADMEGNPSVSTPEWNQYISQSQKRLFNKLVAAYGNDYNVAPLFQFQLNNGSNAMNGAGQYYPLPNGTIPTLGQTVGAPALYKLLGVDLLYTASPTGFVTLKRFEEIERNKYAWPNTAVNFLGYTNLRYRVSGAYIEFIPVPMTGQTVQLKYIQKPASLQFLPSCISTLGSSVVTMPDASDLSIGMSAYGPGVQPGATVTAINLTAMPNQVTLSLPILAGYPVVTLAFWIDSVTIDGIAGWEEYVITDAAIKAKVKQEQPIDELLEMKREMDDEITGLAEGRDAGQAHHVSDVLSANGYGFDGMGDGFGGDGGCGF